jgi:hypothetical protein
MAPQPPIHPWRRPLIRGLGARSSVTGSVFPTDMGCIGASGFASEKYFQRTEPAPERRAMFLGVAGPCSAERDSPRMALACCKVGLDRPQIPTALVANWFRSARVRRPYPNHRESAAKSPSPLAKWGYGGVPMARHMARVSQPQVTAMGQSDPLPRTPHGH